MTPLVSILIGAFNAEKWIADTLRSALAQTWNRKEIIVVDDGSTDHTLSIAQQFQSQYVRVVSQPNLGASAAKNTARALSQGDYIQWLDADDLLAPDKLACQLQRAASCASKLTLFSSAWGVFTYRHYRTRLIADALWSDLSPGDWLITKMEGNLYMPVHAWLVSRELTDAAGLWDERQLKDSDGEYFCRVLRASDAVQFVQEAKVYYRASGPRGLSYIGRSSQKLESQWRSIQLHLQYARSLGDTERVRSACLKYLNRSVIYFYPAKTEILIKAEELAEDLGGHLEAPHWPWKYALITAVFGWNFAKHVALLMSRLRWATVSLWDNLLFRLERLAGNSGADRMK